MEPKEAAKTVYEINLTTHSSKELSISSSHLELLLLLERHAAPQSRRVEKVFIEVCQVLRETSSRTRTGFRVFQRPNYTPSERIILIRKILYFVLVNFSCLTVWILVLQSWHRKRCHKAITYILWKLIFIVKIDLIISKRLLKTHFFQ